MATFAEQARDIRAVARTNGIKLTRKQVTVAVDQHRRGKGYLDAVKYAHDRSTTRTGPQTKMGSV